MGLKWVSGSLQRLMVDMVLRKKQFVRELTQMHANKSINGAVHRRCTNKNLRLFACIRGQTAFKALMSLQC